MSEETGCCPRFDRTPWDDREITWENKLFVQDRVRSIFHIPINFGAVMTRIMAKVKASGVESEEMIVLSDEDSLWGANVLVSVTGEVEGGRMTTLSGTFLSKVFEGPYKDIRKWIAEMSAHVAAKGYETETLYFYYTTCPRCAKVYGRNDVVALSKVRPSSERQA